jgi:hypothetical protein
LAGIRAFAKPTHNPILTQKTNNNNNKNIKTKTLKPNKFIGGF